VRYSIQFAPSMQGTWCAHTHALLTCVCVRVCVCCQAACKLLGLTTFARDVSRITTAYPLGAAAAAVQPAAAHVPSVVARARSPTRVPRLLRSNGSCRSVPVVPLQAQRSQTHLPGSIGSAEQARGAVGEQGLLPVQQQQHGAGCRPSPLTAAPAAVRHYFPVVGAAGQCDLGMHLTALAYGE